MHLFTMLVFIYAGAELGGRFATWSWAKTHPDFRVFKFTSYTGKYWRLNGSRTPLVGSPLTDQLQNLHDDTSKPPRGSQHILTERSDW